MILAILLIAAISIDLSDNFVPSASAETINFEKPMLYPENFAYDCKTKQFLVGSLASGGVWRVSKKGKIAPLVQPVISEKTKQPVRTSGIHVDVEERIVYVNELGDEAVSAMNVSSSVAAYNMDTGKRIFKSKLAPIGTFFNDIFVGYGKYNLFATDSFSPVLYRLVVRTKEKQLITDTEKLVWKKIEHPLFAVPPNSMIPFGLDGLTYDRKCKALLLVNLATGVFIKVDYHQKSLNNPDISEIIVDDGKTKFHGDAIKMLSDGTMIAVTGVPDEDRVLIIESNDCWKTAKTKVTMTLAGKTGMSDVEEVDGKLYVLSGYVGELSMPPEMPKAFTSEATKKYQIKTLL